MTSTFNPALEAHVHQVRSSMLQDLVDAAPLSLHWDNRYLLVRPDGASRQYELDLTNHRWALRRESTLDNAGHFEVALLRSYGRRVDPVQEPMLSLDQEMAQQAREWWTSKAPLPASSSVVSSVPKGVNPIVPRTPAYEDEATSATDPALLASFGSSR